MQYLRVSVIYRTMTHTTGSLPCLHYLLVHVHTHEFAFIYSVRLNDCLFHGGGGSLGPPVFVRECLWAPFCEILEATVYRYIDTDIDLYCECVLRLLSVYYSLRM